MDTQTILVALKSERDRIDQAIAALEALASVGRRVKARHMNAAARKRISEAAKARWAAYRNKTGQAAPKRAKRHISAAGRKHLSEILKARWASGKMGKRRKVA